MDVPNEHGRWEQHQIKFRDSSCVVIGARCEWHMFSLGGWRPGKAVRGDFDGTLSDLVVLVRHIR